MERGAGLRSAADGDQVASQGIPLLLAAEVEVKARSPVDQHGIILLIRRMSQENILWGAPRIRDELALLGHQVAESTVARYLVKDRSQAPSQTWRSFLANHMNVTAACNFLVVPTLTFNLLQVFVVLPMIAAESCM